MYYLVKDIVGQRPVIGFGAGEFVDRAMRAPVLEFDYFVDPQLRGGRKFGRPIYGLEHLRDEKRDVAIFVFQRYIPSAIAQLDELGFKWQKQVYDSRYFGVSGQYFDKYVLIRDMNDLAESGLIDLFTGGQPDLQIENITIPRGAEFAKIRLYVGDRAKVSVRNVTFEQGVTIQVGSEGFVEIGAGTAVRENCRLTVGVGATLAIGSNVLLSHNSIIDAANNIPISIGDSCTFGWNLHLYGYAPISIGDGSMFSSNIYVESGAGHDLIVDGKKKYPRQMDIGKRVWMGMGCCVLAGGMIGSHSMVGAMSLVNSCFGERELIAGNPARTIKHGIEWDRNYTAYKEVYDCA